LTKEWATSQSVTVSMPSADSDKAFNDALRKLASRAEEYGQKDNRRIVVVVVDLVYSLRDARASAMHEGLHGPTVDKVLMKVIESYIDQIESEWA